MTQSRRAARVFYEVVTAGGCGIHKRVDGPLADAQRAAAKVAEAADRVDFGPVELQQVIEFPDRSRRYFLRSGTRWVPWHHREEFEDRKPDWWWPCAAAAKESV